MTSDGSWYSPAVAMDVRHSPANTNAPLLKIILIAPIHNLFLQCSAKRIENEAFERRAEFRRGQTIASPVAYHSPMTRMSKTNREQAVVNAAMINKEAFPSAR